MTDECQCETCTGIRKEIQRNVGVPPIQRIEAKEEIRAGTGMFIIGPNRLARAMELGEEPQRRVPEAYGEPVRRFTTGATRDVDTNKFDFDGFISPLVLEAYGTYMNYNRVLANGQRRDSDNWQKGIPLTAYIKSGWRHFVDWWRISRGYSAHENLVWAIGGLLFNAMGYLHEALKADPELLKRCLDQMEQRRSQAKR